jgi:hypothetical protein
VGPGPQDPRGAGRNLGDDLETPTQDPQRNPTTTDALTCMFSMIRRCSQDSNLLRDEEVVGSNPATPTRSGAIFYP